MRLRRLALLLGVVTLVYLNHFGNGFHFDDSHTVVGNPAIRSLANIPSFFTDARTFSVLPQNRTWRPLVSTSLAIDYAIGHGLTPWAFQLSTFLLFLVLLALMVSWFEPMVGYGPALFGAALFGLHPAMAETVNYVIQRGDLYATLGCVAATLLYASGWRWTALIPFALAVLAKPTALVWPVLLLAWCWFRKERPGRPVAAAFVLGAALGWLEHAMTPPTYTFGGGSALHYVITQPFVICSYVGAFFLPIHLAADTDWQPFTRVWQPACLLGMLGLAGLIALIPWSARRCRPMAFGLLWFILALLPTSLAPLAEVTNDHRMFFPFVGLTLAVVAALRQVTLPRPVMIGGALIWLIALGAGTVVRNEVWHSDTSLWADAVQKSPQSGRAWMNYGLALMEGGQFVPARDCFLKARGLSPGYSLVEVNLGIVFGALHEDQLADQHFHLALGLSPQTPDVYSFYARWLLKHDRGVEAKAIAGRGLEQFPDNPVLQSLLSPVDVWVDKSLSAFQAHRYDEAEQDAREALRLDSKCAAAYNNLAAVALARHDWNSAITNAQTALRLDPTLQIARNNLLYAQQHQNDKP